jgi:hypothetical protein
MSLRVSVLVPPTAVGSIALLTSLDRQTLPAPEYEVLLGDDERDADLTARLDDLAAHRTNLVRVSTRSATDVASTLLERAGGEYVVAVSPGRTLTAEALARLAERADSTGADLCLGLTGRAGSRPARLSAAPDELGGPAGGLRRRTSATPEQVSADFTGADATVDGAPAVAQALCFLDGTPPDGVRPPAESETAVRAISKSVVWRDGALEVVAEMSPPADVVRASIYSDTTGVEWPLPDVQVDGNLVTLRIDPAAVPGVGALPEGTWWPTLRIGEHGPVLVRSRPLEAHGASMRGRTVVSFARGGRLGVDVGGLRHQPIRRIDPAATTVVEDSRGSLLTTRLANVDLAPGARHRGRLRLGGLPVVAWIEEQEGSGAVLQAWVSGLAGKKVIRIRFGRGRYARTDSQLVIDGLGAMHVAAFKHAPRTKPPRPAPTAPSAGPVARARRFAGRVKRSVRR